MKTLWLLLLSTLFLIGNDKAHTFESSETCKSCHPLIYEEFQSSTHLQAPAFKDPIHKAVWDKHPKNLNAKQYTCGKCHTPAADNLDDMLTPGKSALPDANNPTHAEGISCAYCHRIQSIEHHDASNTNIINPKMHHYYGTRGSEGSPFHTIDSTSNEHIKNGNICIGCHSHRMNSHGLNVCSTNIENEMDDANCVTCHMPKVNGSVSNLTKTKKHAYHGFPGTHQGSDLLAAYIRLDAKKTDSGFTVTIDNHSSHALLLHPMRLAVLKTTVLRGNERIILPDETFARVLGKDGKPAMPWIADTTLKDTMLKEHEKRTLSFERKLRKGDRVEVVLGYFLVNPKIVKNLGLSGNKDATDFHLLKKKVFDF